MTYVVYTAFHQEEPFNSFGALVMSLNQMHRASGITWRAVWAI
jgi:hypothetical protein